MMNMTCGIYCIHNIITGKLYVGASNDIDRRYSEHLSSLRKGRKNNSHFQNEWDKYGEDVYEFVILEKCLEEDLDEAEQDWLDHYEDKIGWRMMYNISRYVDSPMRGIPFTLNHRLKLKKNHADVSGANNPMYGKTHTDEIKRRISIANSGRRHTDEAKHKMSVTRMGANNPNAKLTSDDADDILYYRSVGWKVKDLCNEFGVSRSTIERVLRGNVY